MIFRFLISLVGVAVYAVMGAMAAFCICGGYGFECMGGFGWSYLVATVLAMLLAALFKKLLMSVFGRCRTHLIRQAYYMDVALRILRVVAVFAVCANIMAVVNDMSPVFSSSDLWKPFVAVMTVTGLMGPFVQKGVGEWVHNQSFTMYDVLASGLSVVTVLMLFSFRASVSLMGMRTIPLSVNYLAAASLLGGAFVCRPYSVDVRLYRREAVSLILAPVGAFLVTYMLLYLSWNRDDILDFAIMAAAVILLCGVYFFGYARLQRRQHEVAERLLETQRRQIYESSRALSDMELKMVIAENKALQDAVEMKRQEVMNVALSIVEQKEYLESLNAIVKQLSKAKDEEQRNRLVNDIGISLRQRLSYERDVDSQYFYAQAESLHEDFNAKLSENFPALTQQERRLATLLRLGFSSKYIATLMHITPKSVEISRYRLRQKLGLERSDNLVNFIKSI